MKKILLLLAITCLTVNVQSAEPPQKEKRKRGNDLPARKTRLCQQHGNINEKRNTPHSFTLPQAKRLDRKQRCTIPEKLINPTTRITFIQERLLLATIIKNLDKGRIEDNEKIRGCNARINLAISMLHMLTLH